MNFIACESAQKLQGCYYTTPDIARFLTTWVLEIIPRRILEPACGDGVFFQVLVGEQARLDAVVGCEIDPAAARQAGRHAKALCGNVELVAGDFLDWYLTRAELPPEFDAVLGNPPFIRYQYLDRKLQARAERIFQKHGLRFTRHTNAWVTFVVASLALLRPGGRLAMVVPSELLHVMHARSLRQFLLAQCSRILLIDPESIWFDKTLQGTLLLLAEKKRAGEGKACQLAITAVRGRDALSRLAQDYVARAAYLDATGLDHKWMPALLSTSERALLERLGQKRHVHRFREIAAVDVGIVTGANHFFHVPDELVARHRLKRWAHPMFGRSEHVRGVIYDLDDHAANARQRIPTNFLWFRPQDRLSKQARTYIAQGESQGLHRRFKCRIRSPWYSVPSVYSSPVALLKRCHHFPRLVLNKARALTTDTAYRVTPAEGVRAADLVLAFVNSLTALSAELEGRHYGGGVLELVPSEIERLLIPLGSGNGNVEQLACLDHSVRTDVSALELLEKQDSVILRPIGIGPSECIDLRAAWHRLRARRQRTPLHWQRSSQ